MCRLKVERSDLPEEEKKFIVHRLNIVTSQVQKASGIVESLRVFSGGSFSGFGDTTLKRIFEKIHGLMGQQFISRGIEVRCEYDQALPSIRNNPTLVEGIMVQGLAFARDAVAALGVWHDQRSIPYKKILTIRFTELNGICGADILWDSGALPADMSIMDAKNHTGLSTAGTVLASMGGRFEAASSVLSRSPFHEYAGSAYRWRVLSRLDTITTTFLRAFGNRHGGRPYELIVGPASLSAFKPEVAAFTANDNHCPFSDT